MASVKVAVRVRPFNQRELSMESIPIIEMDGKKTRICNHKLGQVHRQDGDASREKYKDFTFDYSYWSFDQSDSHFVNQEKVFQDLGTDVVKNSFEGYNSCVFAYGQTGSGKTHTMMGSQDPPDAQGLIPRICMDLFNRMTQGKKSGTTYNTEVSYLEIYNERVKDLLTKDQTHSLKVREHPKIGPYVEGLSKHLVQDYSGILDLMMRGNSHRTTASTNMNDTSSRSHAIITLNFVQACFVDDMPSETVSKIHLVDLAGSERADASGATGKRLKEGGHINKSLVTLGSVISALAELSQFQQSKGNSHHKSPFIPYRDSVLTWLLKDSLGGNAKTIMIATISPADCNYAETLSTLRYANRAKNIINKPTINEDPNVKLIRELRAEIDKLKRKLTNEAVSELAVLEELHKKEEKERSLTEEWTEKWKETQKILMEQKDLALRKAGVGIKLDSMQPHLIGIDDDLLSTGITLYHLKEGETKIGSEEGNDKQDVHDIVLKGLGLEGRHCSILLESGIATLVPSNGALCWVNGQQVDKPTRLFQGCVILLGRTSMFRYNDPAEAEKLRREGPKSHLSLSRVSFLSRSVTDLGMSSENLNSTLLGEENTALEEKRKQLDAEEARLQKESKELLQQKELLEQQKSKYQQLQREKEEAWQAEQINKSVDIQVAQREIELKKQKLEIEYAAHRRRLAEDWKRLEQQEQETLASLQSKEIDLKRRRDQLEWEVGQEMEQIEAEAARVDSLKLNVEKIQSEVTAYADNIVDRIQEKLGKPAEEIRSIFSMDNSQFENYLETQTAFLEEWKNRELAKLVLRKDELNDKLKEVTQKINECDNDEILEKLKIEETELNNEKTRILSKESVVQNEYQAKKDCLDASTKLMADSRVLIAKKNQECKELNQDIEKGINRMLHSEKKIEKLESDLSLIADQEKLIVSQLSHINNSKQKLLTIIEHSSEDPDARTESPENYPEINSLNLPKSSSRDPSPNRTQQNQVQPIDDIFSPIKQASSFGPTQILTPPVTLSASLSQEEIQCQMKRLIEQINDQKGTVLECLENDCDTKELNHQMSLLQEMRTRYLHMEALLDGKSRVNKWFEDDDSSFSFDKGGDDTTPGCESELDDSEAQSSIADQDDQIQMLIEQGVEKRLKEIFEDLKSGKSGLNRSLRRSLPSGLNNCSSDSDDETGNNLRVGLGIPRSVSMNSELWSALSPGSVIPDVLDISIVNFILRGAGSNSRFEYEILITTPLEKWTILRRYNRFRELRKYVGKKYGSKVSNIPFPSKTLFGIGRTSAKVALERKPKLEGYLKSLIKVCYEIPTCPLHKCDMHTVKESLIAFSVFFYRGVFDSTKYGTS